MTRPIRVFLAEDEPLLRSGLRSLAEHDGDIEVVGEAGDGLVAVAGVRRHRPDVVLMDVRMPGTDGISAAEQISADPMLAATRVLVLTTFAEDETVLGAVRAGASGYLLKDVDAARLRAAIREVAAGGSVLAPEVVPGVMRAAGRTAPVPELVEHLSVREREVLALVGEGLSNADVAAWLVISPETVRTYVSRLLAKVPARDRAQLVDIAHRSGIVRPNERG